MLCRSTSVAALLALALVIACSKPTPAPSPPPPPEPAPAPVPPPPPEPEPPPDTTCREAEPANLWITGTERMNPDPSGSPLPTLVRVYQLERLGELEQASFEQMMMAPSEVLGDTVLGSEEVTVYPGKSVYRPLEVELEARYVVAVAVVRRPSGTRWRAVLRTPTCSTDAEARPMIRFVVDGYVIDGEVSREPSPEGCDDEDFDCLRTRARQ